MRDEFPKHIAETLAKRVGNRCSNPGCRKPTSGPHTQDVKALNVGVAAHITAAAAGGPRYDPSLTPKQRRAIANAIWLCQSCAKLVDNDAQGSVGMGVDPVRNIKIDPRVDSYKTFFDHAWSRKLDELVAGSKLAEPVFSLCMNWKSAANTHLMPWLMIENLKGFWQGVLRGQESANERAVAHLARHVPAAMGDSLSHMKRKKLAEVMGEVGGRMKEFREEYNEEIDLQALFDTFLYGPGGSELQLSIWGSQRIVYGAMYHAYENFVSRCISLARNDPDYRAFTIKALRSDAKAAFGDTTADYCLNDPPIDGARLVRNALTHQGGKETEELKTVAHGIDVVDGELQIMPDDNRRLFSGLKDRVFPLAETALTLPHCK